MERLFFTSGIKCESECLYCFAKQSKYDNIEMKSLSQKLHEIMKNKGKCVIYPSCDSEVVNIGVVKECLKSEFDSNGNIIIIAYSTKSSFSDEKIAELKLLDDELKSKNKGFVRIAISFSTKSRIQEIENNTASYEERIELLKRLYEIGLESSVILKPILPFIETEEYYEIVNDTIAYSKYFLVGGLYFTKGSKFEKKYLNKYNFEEREISWIKTNPSWDYIASINKQKDIIQFISDSGALPFENDLDLLSQMIKKVL